MEEKRIKLPRKYGCFSIGTLTNKDKLLREQNKKDKSITNSEKKFKIISTSNIIDSSLSPITTTTDSTVETNKKKKQNFNIVYKKNMSKPKTNVNILTNQKSNSSRKKMSSITKFPNLQNIFFPLYKEEINPISSTQNIFNESNYNNRKIHGNNEIQDKIQCHTIKNTNNIKVIYNKKNSNINSHTNSNNMNDSINEGKNNQFINIEDLMLLEEKYNDVLISIKLKSNITNECLEFINFYNQSSLFNNFENCFKEINSKIIAHNSIMYMIYDIILIYHLSFDSICISSCCNYLMNMIKMNHDSYLLLCDFISNKISSTEKENIWVKKLRLMLNNNLFHLNLNNEQYVNYLMSKNFSLNFDDDNSNNVLKSLYELKYYIFTIEKYIKILLNYFYDQKLKVGFVDIFQNLKDRNMTIEKLNLFFFTKVLRIINKNASVGGAGASMYGTDNERQKYEKVPYLEYPCPKKFSLILDLDETLISFKIDETQQNKGILKFRPGLDDFLKSVKQNYEIIVFTSATQQYADPIENEIENNIKYFDVRLYRQHTIIHDNHFVKDISRIGRPLDKILIVDNMPQNYKLQKENGIMIKPFWGEDNDDTTLFSLGNILNKIADNFDDVRKGILFYKDDILNKISSNFSRKENEQMKFEI